jgi:tRNA-binding protein
MATVDDFAELDIRVGKIINIEDFPKARKPAYKLIIDFGPNIGTKLSSAQLPANYTKDELLHKFVLCVVNFPPRQIGSFMSECLTLGVPDGEGNCMLITPDKNVPVGGRLY